jgi:hypothetical protein
MEDARVENEPLRICVAIPTFRRPATLAPLLEALAGLTFSGVPPAVEVLIVDNDPEGSARAIVEQKRPLFHFALHYARVPRPGLSVVRNYALDFAKAGYDALAMIDDDESPLPAWLDEMLVVRAATRADAVIGHVVASLPADAPRWIRGGGFFDLPLWDDRKVLNEGHSANCLIMLAAVRKAGLSFDPDMNEAGGEDQLFFRQLVARGGRIAFAARAIVIDWIPPGRLNAKYILSRELRKGNTLAICDRKIFGTPRVLGMRAAKGVLRLLLGLVTLFPRALIGGRRGFLEASIDLARGTGMLLGLAGVRISGYKRAGEAGRSLDSVLERDPTYTR